MRTIILELEAAKKGLNLKAGFKDKSVTELEKALSEQIVGVVKLYLAQAVEELNKMKKGERDAKDFVDQVVAENSGGSNGNGAGIITAGGIVAAGSDPEAADIKREFLEGELGKLPESEQSNIVGLDGKPISIRATEEAESTGQDSPPQKTG